MIFTFIILTVFLLVLVLEGIVHKSVYGPLLNDEFLDKYFDKRWKNYTELNTYDSYIISGDPYLAVAPSFFTRWHISDIGCIPRWSKWSKALDDLRVELLLK